MSGTAFVLRGVHATGSGSPRPATANVKVAVIGIPHEAVPAQLQLLVHPIEQRVGQQHERPALRRALIAPCHHTPSLMIPLLK